MSEHIAEEMVDNVALREILGEVRLLDGIIRERYDDILSANPVTVEDGTPYTRDANPDAVKTVVTNRGATNKATIFEGGALVKVLDPGDTWVSPLNGGGEIEVTAAAGAPTTISVATYVRT
jgi:hypothetical protein